MDITTKEQGIESRRKIYDFVKSYINENQYPPSVREICEGTGLKSTGTIHHQLEVLEDMGVISREYNRPRTLKILAELVE